MKHIIAVVNDFMTFLFHPTLDAGFSQQLDHYTV